MFSHLPRWHRRARPRFRTEKPCSVSLATDWQAGSAPAFDAPKAGAASHVPAADGDCDDDVVFVGVTMDGDRVVFNLAQNEAESADEPDDDKVRDAGEGV